MKTTRRPLHLPELPQPSEEANGCLFALALIGMGALSGAACVVAGALLAAHLLR